MVPSKFHYVKNMRLRKVSKLLIAMCAILVLSVSMPSCGTMHSYWGVEHEYEFPEECTVTVIINRNIRNINTRNLKNTTIVTDDMWSVG